uniref:Uncharacterized protein n=1 Tax=Haptolina brevifila TaxID=156173 RepID=A0A7S2HMV1_9EUKA
MNDMWTAPKYTLTSYETYLDERIGCDVELHDNTSAEDASSQLEAKYLVHLRQILLEEQSAPVTVSSPLQVTETVQSERCGTSKRQHDQQDMEQDILLPELSAWARAAAEQELHSPAAKRRKQRNAFWASAVVDVKGLIELSLG